MEVLFELLRIATGAQSALSFAPSVREWGLLFAEAQKQSIEGVLLDGLERLPTEKRPPKMVLLQWIGQVQIIEQNTRQLTIASAEVIKYFHDNGFACTLLKGAAVGRYYPLPERRRSGDIDIWLNGNRETIYDFARDFDKEGKLYGVNYHHIHFHLLDNVHIELHIWPSFLSSPLRNKRLHKFFNLHRPTMENDMPSLSFDRIFILLHCYRHMCGHGVGLRQIMDYYYVLKHGFTVEEKQDSVYWIKKLGMWRFASGVMWILNSCFGLEDQHLLMPPDEKEGQFILNEVMITGNFGHGETRHWGSTKTPMSRFMYNLKRDVHFIRHYPHEAIWQPFFSLWLYSWRLVNGYI